MNDTFIDADDSSDLTARVTRTFSPTEDPILLLHGLSGDENVMWILQSALPDDSLILAPRGLYPYTDGGWSWVPNPDELGERLQDYSASAQVLEDWLPRQIGDSGLQSSRPVLIGFSQGAALAFALAARRRLRPKAVVALAGFLPAGELAPLARVPIFWGHGVLDEVVPFERAKRDLSRLQEVGAEPHLCTADVGHKVGVECMRGLRRWLSELDQ